MTTAAFAPPQGRSHGGHAPGDRATRPGKVIPLRADQRLEMIPAWLPQVVDRINTLARMDVRPGVDAPAPPTEAAATAALDAILHVMWFETPTPAVVPMYDGGLQLEWHAPGVDIELTVAPTGDRQVWIEAASGLEIDGPFRAAAEDLRKHLGALSRK